MKMSSGGKAAIVVVVVVALVVGVWSFMNSQKASELAAAKGADLSHPKQTVSHAPPPAAPAAPDAAKAPATPAPAAGH